MRENPDCTDNIRTWETRKNLGLMRMGLGDVTNGYTEVRQAIAAMEKVYGGKHGDVLTAHRDAGVALVKAGRFAEAVPHLKRVTADDAPATVRVDLADDLFAGLRRSRAFTELERREQ